ncbi:MAG: hypothetical protein M3321_02925 [Actinomycetota bacterium]|nr:hypothetical protein [Actinomycetota bacterium]
MTYYVKMIGASDLPLPNTPFQDIPSLLRRIRFPREQFPSYMTPGDELVYYAVGGYKGLFAIAELTSKPERDVPIDDPVVRKRWPHAADVTIRMRLDRVTSGPQLAEVSPALQQNVTQGTSHFEIGRPEFERAYELLRKAKAAEELENRRLARMGAPAR